MSMSKCQNVLYMHIVKISSHVIDFCTEPHHVSFKNRSIQQHALQTFPSNVESRTIHSLAFRGVGFRLVQI